MSRRRREKNEGLRTFNLRRRTVDEVAVMEPAMPTHPCIRV